MGIYNNGYKVSRVLNSYIGIVVGVILSLGQIGTSMPFLFCNHLFPVGPTMVLLDL